MPASSVANGSMPLMPPCDRLELGAVDAAVAAGVELDESGEQLRRPHRLGLAPADRPDQEHRQREVGQRRELLVEVGARDDAVAVAVEPREARVVVARVFGARDPAVPIGVVRGREPLPPAVVVAAQLGRGVAARLGGSRCRLRLRLRALAAGERQQDDGDYFREPTGRHRAPRGRGSYAARDKRARARRGGAVDPPVDGPRASCALIGRRCRSGDRSRAAAPT
jgi:hypothetical protein